VDDYEAIRQVFAAYAHAMDNGRATELAELFEPDGAFELLGEMIEGRVAIAAMVDRFRDAGAIGEGKHITVNSVITVDGTQATAHSDWLVLQPRDQRWSVLAAGQYEDLLTKTDRWRLALRRDVIAGPVPKEALE